MEWIIFLYIFFIIFSAILSAIKESQKKQITIPKKLEPVIIEKELEKEVIKPKKIEIELPKLEEKRIVSPSYKIEEEKIPTFIEVDLKEKLPEIIVLMEILGPPRALQGFGPPYRRKVL